MRKIDVTRIAKDTVGEDIYASPTGGGRPEEE